MALFWIMPPLEVKDANQIQHTHVGAHHGCRLRIETCSFCVFVCGGCFTWHRTVGGTSQPPFGLPPLFAHRGRNPCSPASLRTGLLFAIHCPSSASRRCGGQRDGDGRSLHKCFRHNATSVDLVQREGVQDAGLARMLACGESRQTFYVCGRCQPGHAQHRRSTSAQRGVDIASQESTPGMHV